MFIPRDGDGPEDLRPGDLELRLVVVDVGEVLPQIALSVAAALPKTSFINIGSRDIEH